MPHTAAEYMAEAEAGMAAEDRAAGFVRLLEEHTPALRRLAARFGLRGAELDDAVQEIVIRAWAGRAGFRGDSEASTWLTRIAINYLTSYRRKWARRWQLWTRHRHEVADRKVYAQPAETGNIRHQKILDAIEGLPARLRKVFVLRYVEEMTVDEVATILEIPPGTVRSRGYHARLRLRDALKDQNHD